MTYVDARYFFLIDRDCSHVLFYLVGLFDDITNDEPARDVQIPVAVAEVHDSWLDENIRRLLDSWGKRHGWEVFNKGEGMMIVNKKHVIFCISSSICPEVMSRVLADPFEIIDAHNWVNVHRCSILIPRRCADRLALVTIDFLREDHHCPLFALLCYVPLTADDLLSLENSPSFVLCAHLMNMIQAEVKGRRHMPYKCVGRNSSAYIALFYHIEMHCAFAAGYEQYEIPGVSNLEYFSETEIAHAYSHLCFLP